MSGVTLPAMIVVLRLMAAVTGGDTQTHASLDYTPNDVFCLAQNIYFEARNEPYEGRLSVAAVTLNRVQSPHFPDTPCGVTWQRKQFSWTHDGKSDRIPIYRVKGHVWPNLVRVALRSLSPYTDDPTNGSTYYHAEYVNPQWTGDRGMHKVIRIGDHIFYRRTR